MRIPMKLRHVILGLMGTAFVLFAGAAKADILKDCSSCFGMSYLLEYVKVTDTEYKITFTIYTAGSTLPGDWVSAVAIKPAPQIETTSSFVSTTAPDPSSWHGQLGGLNSSGCSGAGAGYICAQDGTSALLDGSTYSWTFDVFVSDASKWLLGTLGASVKANFDGPTTCGNGCLLSNNITLQQHREETPEPQTLALLGIGLVGLGLIRRRRAS